MKKNFTGANRGNGEKDTNWGKNEPPKTPRKIMILQEITEETEAPCDAANAPDGAWDGEF
jgi:hypothetical protein